MRGNRKYLLGGLFCILLLLALRFSYSSSSHHLTPSPDLHTQPTGEAADFLFCHWNVERLPDHSSEKRMGVGNKELDALFAQPSDLLSLKMARLTEAILKMNEGKGPDILGLIEIESKQAAEQLKKNLNEHLKQPAWHYQNLQMLANSSGRHLTPMLLTRLPVIPDRTRALGNRQRTLEVHLVVNGHELIVIITQWKAHSRDSSDQVGAEEADHIYRTCQALHRRNPAADILISGDFNENPEEVPVRQHLHSGSEIPTVHAGASLTLFNLMAGKDPRTYGTYYHQQRWHLHDQIILSPGLLDREGWTCKTESFRVCNELSRPKDAKKRPWPFRITDGKEEHGYSDHFPLTVQLHLERAREK